MRMIEIRNLTAWAVMLAAVAAAITTALVMWAKPAEATFPGSNGAIAFQSSAQAPQTQVYRMNPDGSSQTRLSNDLVAQNSPDWSADGKKIAFTGAAAGEWDIYWMNSDGSGATNLTPGTEVGAHPAFFPDYHKIAFASWMSGNQDIWRLAVDDNGNPLGLTQLTTNSAFDYIPAVSPNGKKIAFVSNRADGNYDIYVMKANKPEGPNNVPVRITTRAAQDFFPSWSPDGRKIAFVRQIRGNTDIYVMKPRPEGTDNRPRNITLNAADDNVPAWSPDGTQIVFQSDRDRSDGGDYDIFKMNSDGSGTPTQLTNNPVPDQEPSWQPVVP
jgi:Tol biopolymer transport system component